MSLSRYELINSPINRVVALRRCTKAPAHARQLQRERRRCSPQGRQLNFQRLGFGTSLLWVPKPFRLVAAGSMGAWVPVKAGRGCRADKDTSTKNNSLGVLVMPLTRIMNHEQSIMHGLLGRLPCLGRTSWGTLRDPSGCLVCFRDDLHSWPHVLAAIGIPGGVF